jgi:nucleoside-diphosphate-sugar epimerase
VRAAVLDARPSAVVHQLTDLPKRLDPAALAAALERNARLREVGTRHLVDAAAAAGVAAVVAQSIAFAYAPGPKPYTEDQPLNGADPTMARTVQGVQALERLVLGGPFRGVVLRYGRLYGPGTWAAEAPAGGPVHVDAAAHAARLALRGGSLGVYNVAEPDGTVAIDKVVGEFEWDPAFRVGLRAPGPQGAGGGDMMTREGNR